MFERRWMSCVQEVVCRHEAIGMPLVPGSPEIGRAEPKGPRSTPCDVTNHWRTYAAAGDQHEPFVTGIGSLSQALSRFGY